MKIGFLGHNGFALGVEDSPVLVDPILYRRYGEEYTSSPVEIYPPRLIDIDRMPQPAAVILSHEHSDHFHLPSLNKLDKSTPIIVGPTMIDTVVECIESLGLTVTRLPFGEPTRFGSVIVTLFPPGPDTVLWESRVSQVYVLDASEPDRGGVFLGIDASTSTEFIDAVSSGALPAPRVVAMSNNAQVTPPGVFGSLDCYRPAGQTAVRYRGQGFPGLDILEEIVAYAIEQSEIFRGAHILLCGGGFLKDYEQMGPFPFSEQQEMARLAKQLVRHMDVMGPVPGDVVEVGEHGIDKVGELSWLGVDHERFAQLIHRRESFLARRDSIAMRCIEKADEESENAALSCINRELTYLSRVLLLSDFGRRMAVSPSEHPFVLKLKYLTRPDRTLRFDLAAGAFEEAADLPLDDSVAAYPNGIYIHAVDFAAVLRGDLQYWDVVGIAMRTWFDGDALSSPVALFYDALGEQVRPDLSCRVYQQQLEYLEKENA
ncbi:MBL fold metallo-hydrolase [Micromonospora echinospora]|uniref:MBL fold metallo-hydrolase n=1 Tax=Micromonospora echinospora TaxID=1877 RepID=UPI0033DB2808